MIPSGRCVPPGTGPPALRYTSSVSASPAVMMNWVEFPCILVPAPRTTSLPDAVRSPTVRSPDFTCAVLLVSSNELGRLPPTLAASTPVSPVPLPVKLFVALANVFDPVQVFAAFFSGTFVDSRQCVTVPEQRLLELSAQSLA